MMFVDINEIERCLRYFKAINAEALEEIVWMRGDEKLTPDPELLEEYRFIGLSNRDFPSVAGWLPDDIGIRVATLALTKAPNETPISGARYERPGRNNMSTQEIKPAVPASQLIGQLERFRPGMSGDVLMSWAADAQAEIDALRRDAERYRWLRTQPNDISAPRIDVVYWTQSDESANEGEGLRMEALDAAIDNYMRSNETEIRGWLQASRA